MFVVFSCSLNPDSRSRILAEAATSAIRSHDREVELVDLVETPLPMCDGGASYGHDDVQKMGALIADAEGILIASPIYNYDINAAAKNLVELTGQNWRDKVVGFLCAAGGQGSYMSLMPIANSLMLDFRCLILPKFVYAVGNDFRAGEIAEPGIQDRVEELALGLVRISDAVRVPKPAGE